MGNFFTPVEIRVRYELKRLSAVVGFDHINGLSGRVGSLGFANQENVEPFNNLEITDFQAARSYSQKIILTEKSNKNFKGVYDVKRDYYKR